MTDQDKKQVPVSEEEQEEKVEVKEDVEGQRPHSDIYSDIEGVDEESGVEIPTDDAVEEAKEWVDEENRR